MSSIVRCVVMGADSLESVSDVRDAVVSTVKNIQSFDEDMVQIQFVIPCDYTQEGWSPLRGAPHLVNELTSSWVDQWFDAGHVPAPIIHPIFTMVDDRAARPIGEAELSPRRLDKNELDALFRLETSFGVRTYTAYSEWVRTVFYPEKWDMFNNMALEGYDALTAPTYALTIHDNGIDEKTLRLEFEATNAGAQVYSFISRVGRDGKRAAIPRVSR